MRVIPPSLLPVLMLFASNVFMSFSAQFGSFNNPNGLPR